MASDICISCKRSVLNTKGSTRFKCPSCSEFEIVRCVDCRKLATKYKCGKCSFEGPN